MLLRLENYPQPIHELVADWEQMIYSLLHPDPSQAPMLSRAIDSMVDTAELLKGELGAGYSVSMGLMDLGEDCELDEEAAYDFLKCTGNLLFNSQLEPREEASELKEAIAGYQLLTMELMPV